MLLQATTNINHTYGLQPVPSLHYATHRNGRGSLIGTDIHCSHDSYVDAASTISGRSVIVGSTIVNSTVIDSVILGAAIANSVISECIITPLHGKSPSVDLVEITRAIIEGNTQLIGPWKLSADQVEARIPCGVWYRPPLYREVVGESAIEGYQVKVGITESTDDHALIACMRKPISQWLGRSPDRSPGRRLGRILGWTDNQTLEVYRFFEYLRDRSL